MAIPAVREIIYRYIAQFEDAERGFSKLHKDTRALNKETKDYNDTVKATIKELEKTAKAGKVEAFDTQGLEDYISNIKNVERRTERLGTKIRAAFSVDPKVRREAKLQLQAIQNYSQAIQGAVSRVDRLKAATAQLAKAEADFAKASNQSARAHAQNAAGRARVAIRSINEEEGGWEKLFRTLKSGDQDLSRASKSLAGAGAKAATFTQNFNTLTARLRQVFPVMRGVAVIIGAALVPGFFALAGAVAAAGTAMVGFAGAVAGAAIPAMSVLAGFFSRLGAVMDAVKQKQTAINAAQLDGTGPTSQLAASNDALRQAHQRVSDSAFGVQEAEERLADASEQAGQATADAMREIAEAAEEARDAVLALERAELSLDQARLEQREAKADLKKLRDEAGLTGDSIANAFKRFTDVDVDFDAKEFAKLADREGLTQEDQFDVEHAVLRVRDANLSVKESIDGVDDAEHDLNATRARSHALAVQGVEDTDAVADAQRGLMLAHREAADANRALRRQEILTGEARRGLTPGMKTARQAMRDLSDAERELARKLLNGRDAFLDFVRSGTDPMMRALSDVIERFKRMRKEFSGGLGLASLQGSMRMVGEAFGRLIRRFGRFASKDGIGIFAVGADLARKLLGVLSGGLMQNALRLVGNLTQAFGPGLVQVLRMIRGAFKSMADSTSGLQSGDKRVKVLVKAFKELMRLVGAVGEAIVAFGVAVGPAGTEMVKWLREGVESFTEWMKSTEGKNSIKKFFKDTLPFAKAVIKFLVKGGSLALKVFQFFAPAMTDFFEGLDLILDVLHPIVDLLNGLPTIVKRLIGLFTPFLLAMRGGIFATQISLFWGRFTTTIGAVATAITALGGIAKDAFEKIIDAWEWLIDQVKKVLGISSPSKVFLEIGKDVIRGFANGIEGAWKLAVRGFKFVIRKLIGGAEDMLSRAYELGKRIVNRLIEGARSLVDKVVTLGGDFLRWLARGIRATPRTVVDAFRFVWARAKEYFDRLLKIGGAVYEIGKGVVSQIAQGIKDFAHKVTDAIEKLLGDVWDLAKRVLDVHSPSKKYEHIGHMMMEGLAKGIAARGEAAKRTLANIFDAMPEGFRFEVAGQGFMKAFTEHDHPSRFAKRHNIVKFTDMDPISMGARQGLRLALGLIGVTIRTVKSLGQDLLSRYVPVPDPESFFQAEIRKRIPFLAAGGVVTGDTFARVGEAGREAVIPLRRAVMRDLGEQIARSMAVSTGGFGGPELAGVGAGGGQMIHIDKVELPQPPSGAMDARYAAVQFTRELKRRAGS